MDVCKMVDDIEIIEDVKKESNFNYKEYFTLSLIMIILSFLQLIFSYVDICNDYLNTITIFKVSNNILLIGTIVIFILNVIIVTNLTQNSKLSGLCGIAIGLIGFFLYPIITEIIGVLLFIDGIRLIIKS